MTNEPTTTRVSLNIDVAVPVSVAYAAVSDPRKYGRWSPEATGAQLPSGGLLQVGDRFTGRSRVWVQWSGNCVVVAAEPNKRFAFEVSIAGIRVSRWTYETEANDDGGTRVTETWDDLREGITGTVIKPSGVFVGRGLSARDRNAITMAETLRRLKEDLESASKRSGDSPVAAD